MGFSSLAIIVLAVAVILTNRSVRLLRERQDLVESDRSITFSIDDSGSIRLGDAQTVHAGFYTVFNEHGVLRINQVGDQSC